MNNIEDLSEGIVVNVSLAEGNSTVQSFKGDKGGVISTRTHVWNENGQMTMFMDDKATGYYGYDANGERVYKLTGYTYSYDYNAGADTVRAYFNDAVLYVNPYFIVTPKGYTKHYYNGSNRLASKIGNIENLPNDMIDSASNSRAKDYLANLPDLPTADTSTRMHIVAHCEENMLLPILGKSAKKSDLAEAVYYYHGDHLGSAVLITDGNGDAVEHISYLPYGEILHRKRFEVPNYVERYTFTGKEKDEESGYYYFGARYFDAMLLTSFISPDKKLDKYLSTSSYMYCLGNPMRNIDPTGNDVWELDGSGNVTNWEKNTSKDEFRMNDKSISFEYGTVTGYEENGGITRFKFGDEASGADAFKFFADNSKVEYELITTQEGESRVVTQHDDRKVNAGTDIINITKAGMTIKSFIHNHPRNSNPSGFDANDKSGDRFSAKSKDTYLKRSVEHYVYKSRDSRLYIYDFNKKDDVGMPWNFIFQPSTKKLRK